MMGSSKLVSAASDMLLGLSELLIDALMKKERLGVQDEVRVPWQ
jgi:hypothetical protein